MTDVVQGAHTLVLYRSSERADTALRSVCRLAQGRGSRVTVMSVARQEKLRKGCCDTRSVLWNQIGRDLAREELSRASRAVGKHASLDFEVLTAPANSVVDAIAGAALARDADEIVLADPRRSGLGLLERWRLRRRSTVPVSA